MWLLLFFLFFMFVCPSLVVIVVRIVGKYPKKKQNKQTGWLKNKQSDGQTDRQTREKQTKPLKWHLMFTVLTDCVLNNYFAFKLSMNNYDWWTLSTAETAEILPN